MEAELFHAEHNALKSIVKRFKSVLLDSVKGYM
jgi:hypothetical protein